MIPKLRVTLEDGAKVLLTHEELVKLLDGQRPWIDHISQCYKEWELKFYYDELEGWGVCSATSNDDKGVLVTIVLGTMYPRNDTSAALAQLLLGALWDREFPLHVVVKTFQDKSQICGEFLEWLKEQNVRLCEFHNHTDACYDPELVHLSSAKHGPYCDYREDIPYPTTKTKLELLHGFFGVDYKAFQAEKDRMLQELI